MKSARYDAPLRGIEGKRHLNVSVDPVSSRKARLEFARIRAFLAVVALWTALGSSLCSRLAADELHPDAEGYIRHWVMLAPVAIPEGESCADALMRQQIPNEAAIRPKAGETVRVGGKELVWRTVTAPTNYVDFNATLNSINDHVVGYVVTYIECEREIPDVILAVASNDQGRIYFNGVDIYAVTEPRPLMLDADKGRVTLKKGLNVMVFKIANEQNSWQGAMRFLDKSGAPLKNLRIRLAP